MSKTPVMPSCRDVKKMKIYKTKNILILVAIALVIFIAPWVYTFYGQSPSNTSDWAAFGSYIGGTLSPVIALMALLALLHTINQQQKQINHFSNQETKHDLFKIIEKIEKDFYENLNRYPINLHVKGIKYKYSAVDVLLDLSFLNYNEVIFNQDELLEDVAGKQSMPLDEASVLSSCMFATATGQLNQLRTLVKKHDEVAGNNILSLYYIRKYKIAFERLHSKGLIEDVWEK